ncbi:M16 family metallopeptidase [Algoriphagus namhaensis]
MLQFERYFLDNGLEVIVHEDHSSKMAVVNLLYKVGSRNEHVGKTGLAHFFEHLMFGGSKNAPSFDRELERVGGSCNAFTSADITNYYITLPAVNLETALWLESDRMFQLNLSEKTIETQRKVVLEEFKQRYLNQPYGDVQHHLKDLAFELHPYKWPTIGQSLSDVEGYTKEDVLDFYSKNYAPSRAVLVIAGHVRATEVRQLVEKWFGDIPSPAISPESIPEEPKQTQKRTREIQAKVPTDALYKAYKMPGRGEKGYLEADLITDLLGFGSSSLVQRELINKGKLFSSAGAYILGSVDPGLLVLSGKMEEGVSAQAAEMELDQLLAKFTEDQISPRALQKIKNQGEAMKTYQGIQLLNRAMSLAYHAHLGDPKGYWLEFEKKSAISAEQITLWAKKLLQEDQASVLYYQSNQS